MWTVAGSPPLQLTFTSFSLELPYDPEYYDDEADDPNVGIKEAGDCWDYVEVAYQGHIESFCGDTVPGPFTSPGNTSISQFGETSV